MAMGQILFEYVSPVNASFIILLNVLEVIVITKEKRKYANRYFILNLCISDLSVGVTIILTKVFYLFREDKVPAIIMLLVKDCGLRISLSASVLNLTLLTISRLLAVSKPRLHIKLIKTAIAKRACALVWVGTIIMTSLYYFPLKYGVRDSTMHDRYEKLVFTLVTFLAFVMFVMSYALVFVQSRKQRKEDASAFECDDVDREIAERKFLKITSLTVSTFIICWLPIAIYGILSGLRVDGTSKDIENLCITFAFINSSIDPIIYFVIFKPRFRELLCCCFQPTKEEARHDDHSRNQNDSV